MASCEQDLVQAIEAWDRELTNYGLKMNKEKTEVVGDSHVKPRQMNIHIGGQCLNQLSAFKDFGEWLAANGETGGEW